MQEQENNSTTKSESYSETYSDTNSNRGETTTNTVSSHHDDSTSSHHEDEEVDDGCTKLSKKYLLDLFKKNWKLYYRTPSLNEKLYLHYKGFGKIQALEEYTELKCLYIEGNAISKIEGLETCTLMRSLYIQENCLRKIEGLDHMKELRNLNVSDNMIEQISGLENVPILDNLHIKNNRIGKNGYEDLLGLLDCPSISCIDLSGNFIDDPRVLEEVFMKMPKLAVLYLKGNDVTKKIKQYRKKLIDSIPTLKYLDDRPVFVEDRRYAEAFARGGMEAEREERKLVKQEEQEKARLNMENFRQMCTDAREAHKQKKGQGAENVRIGADVVEGKDIVYKDEQEVKEERKKNLKDMIAQAKAEKEKSQKQSQIDTNTQTQKDQQENNEEVPDLEDVDMDEERLKQLSKTKEEKQEEWLKKVINESKSVEIKEIQEEDGTKSMEVIGMKEKLQESETTRMQIQEVTTDSNDDQTTRMQIEEVKSDEQQKQQKQKVQDADNIVYTQSTKQQENDDLQQQQEDEQDTKNANLETQEDEQIDYDELD